MDQDDDRQELRWDCVTSRADWGDDVVAARDRLADAARDGRWTDVFSVLDDTDGLFSGIVTVNSARVGGSSGYAPLHQAAWHGADASVVYELLQRGAWRTLRSTAGETPEQIARRRGHVRLAESVATVPTNDLDTRLLDMETYLAALITVRARQLGKTFRMPQLGPLDEFPDAAFWCSIPGMYGGFAYSWLDATKRTTLDVSSWSRVVGGSGQRHHITGDGVLMVEEGFV